MKTFKQFLVEEWEAKIYTPEEKEHLQPPNPENAEDVCIVGDVVFDQRNGMGCVPYNVNINYMGFVGMILPENFLKLALDHNGQREDSAEFILNELKKGRAVGSPFLQLDVSDFFDENLQPLKNGRLKVKGHEGRARCLAINRFQHPQPIPVHFLLNWDLKARHITKELLESLNDGIIKQGSDFIKVDNAISEVFLNGKAIKL